MITFLGVKEKKSYVVVDGKFVCIDPYLGTKYHLLSDVKNSKLETKVGKFPLFKHKNTRYLNSGIIRNIKVSQFNNFIKRSSDYLPFLKDAKYIGSMFVVRAIMKNKEKTDERTSIVKIHSKKILSIGRDLKGLILIINLLSLNFRSIKYTKKKNCICRN